MSFNTSHIAGWDIALVLMLDNNKDVSELRKFISENNVEAVVLRMGNAAVIMPTADDGGPVIKQVKKLLELA